MRWEYMTLMLDGAIPVTGPSPPLQLEDAGRKGWELCTTVQLTTGLLCIFKRTITGIPQYATPHGPRLI
jgi:hypothetical protein